MPTVHLISGLPCSGRTRYVIFDDGFFLHDHRSRYVTLANDLGCRATIHFIDTPLDVIQARLEQRNANLPRYNFEIDAVALQGLVDMFEVPSGDEGAEIVVVRDITFPGLMGTDR